jgi:hypothetical protein
MTRCDFCKKPIEGLPFTCRRCGGHFCEDHRLPEYHYCRGLRRISPIPQQAVPPSIKIISQPIKPPINPIPKDPVPEVKISISPKKTDNTIDNIPREKLCEIVKIHGETIIENPKRLQALLTDYCHGGNKPEINAIISSLEEKIPQDILKSKNGVPLNILIPKLKKRLNENTYYSEDLITWSIDAWVSALNV